MNSLVYILQFPPGCAVSVPELVVWEIELKCEMTLNSRGWIWLIFQAWQWMYEQWGSKGSGNCCIMKWTEATSGKTAFPQCSVLATDLLLPEEALTNKSSHHLGTSDSLKPFCLVCSAESKLVSLAGWQMFCLAGDKDDVVQFCCFRSVSSWGLIVHERFLTHLKPWQRCLESCLGGSALQSHTETDADIQMLLLHPKGVTHFPTALDFHVAFCLFHVTGRVWEGCRALPVTRDRAEHSWHMALSWMCSSAHTEWERRDDKERPQRECGVSVL